MTKKSSIHCSFANTSVPRSLSLTIPLTTPRLESKSFHQEVSNISEIINRAGKPSHPLPSHKRRALAQRIHFPPHARTYQKTYSVCGNGPMPSRGCRHRLRESQASASVELLPDRVSPALAFWYVVTAVPPNPLCMQPVRVRICSRSRDRL